MRRLVDEHPAALGVPLPAPRVGGVVRGVAPTVLDEHAQRRAPDFPLINGPLHALNGFVKPALANRPECDAALAGRGEHRIAIREARRERLLDQHVNAGLRGAHRGLRVQWVRRPDDDRFGVRVAEHRGEVGERLRAVLRRERPGALGRHVARRDELRLPGAIAGPRRGWTRPSRTRRGQHEWVSLCYSRCRLPGGTGTLALRAI